MSKKPLTVKVTPAGEVASLLRAAAHSPVVLEMNGVRYRLERERQDDLQDEYDPEAVRAALRETAGSWADLDIDAIIDDLHRAREEGSRPASRP